MHINRASKLVAIVVPLSNRKEFTPEEEISLSHLIHFLGKYDKYFMAPEGLQIDYSGFGIKYFDKRFFGSAAANNRLWLSPHAEFYKSFIDYKYILIYHLDSLVFSDQLTQWCGLDFDSIASPWIKHKDAPYAGKQQEGKVGNGGFSLRKVESFLKVINSSRYSIEPAKYWEMHYASKPKLEQYLNLPKKILKYLKIFNNVKWEMSRYRLNEDYFWASRATYYYPEFKIAPLEIALRFAFECVPRYCFKKNNYNLPFGCHAWHKYDREFWESYLLK